MKTTLLVSMALLMGMTAQVSIAQTSDTNAGTTQGQSKDNADMMRQKQLDSDQRADQQRMKNTGTGSQTEDSKQVTNEMRKNQIESDKRAKQQRSESNSESVPK